jgi:predicted enzyme related to lactoylglutathione lyase
MKLRNAPLTTTLPAEDIERAKKFYSQTLNLPTPDMPTPSDSATFECGDGTMLFLYERDGGTKADHTTGIFMVEDVEKTVNELRQKGVAFEKYNMPDLKTDARGIAEIDGIKTAWFKDTEGNILAVSSIPA